MSARQIARRWIEEVWNQRNSDAIPALFAPNAISHGLSGQDFVGPDGFRPFHQAFMNAFADLRMTIDDMIEEDDRLAIRWHATGTHTGGGLKVPASGNPMRITGMSMIRVANGQIVESWNNFDVIGMHRQLGTLAAVAAG